MSKRKWIVAFTVASVALGALALPVLSHCQVPCGIYDDPMRFTMIDEHIVTIEKSMTEIGKLSAEGDKNYNQIVRWVDNKDHHADELADILTSYFLAQRVKPVDAGDADAHVAYLHKLELLHNMLVHTMKAKQTIDLAHVAQLRSLRADFYTAYFGHAEEHAHAH